MPTSISSPTITSPFAHILRRTVPRISPLLLAVTLASGGSIALGAWSRGALAASGDDAASPGHAPGTGRSLHVRAAGSLSMRAPGTSAQGTVWAQRSVLAQPGLLLADNVVVTPPPPQQQPQPAPAVVATVNPSPPPAASTVVEAPRSNKVVHVDVAQPHNYMTTIALSALMGAVAGGLVGGAVYFIGDRNDAQNIAYWAAGGVLVGSAVGLVQILTEETRASEATALHKLPTDPAPTLRLALLRTHF